MFPKLYLFCPSHPHTHKLFISVVSTNSKNKLSPLGSLPHSVAIISVEVSGHFVLVVHTAGFDHIREAQRPEGQRLHSLLNHLDMTTSSCCICLGGEEIE